MRKISVCLCAILAFSILSCSSFQKQLPANVQGTGILAVGVNFKYLSAMGFPSEAEVRYVRAARLSGGTVNPETAIGTDIIKDGVAYFIGVEPGDYVFTDIVYTRNLGAITSVHNQTGPGANVVKLVVAAVSAEDSLKTAVKVEAGSLSYMSRLKVIAEGKIRDLIPDFDEERSQIKKIRIDKGYSVRTDAVDETMGARIKEIIKSDADAASFKNKAHRLLDGTEWQIVLEPKSPAAEVKDPVSDAKAPAVETKSLGSEPGTPAADAVIPVPSDSAQKAEPKK